MRYKFIGLICSFCLIFVAAFACQQQPTSPKIDPPIPPEEILTSEPDVYLIFVQHDSCPWSYFWCVLEKGIKDAAKDLKVKKKLLRPNHTKFDPDEVKKLLEKALEEEPDGIALTLVEPTIFKQLLQEVTIKKNIPVIAYNAGHGLDENEQDDFDYIKSSQVLTYIGGNDYQGGYQGGRKLAKKLANKGDQRRGVCINHLPEAENLKARCRGFLKAMKERGIPADILPTDRNPQRFKEDIEKYYENNSNVNIFLTLGPISATPFYQFISEVGLKPEQFAHGIFDLNQIIIDKVEEGITLFAVDQQPYLQGYLAVQWLTWKIRHEFIPPARLLPTGPNFVDKSNLKIVKPQVGQYR